MSHFNASEVTIQRTINLNGSYRVIECLNKSQEDVKDVSTIADQWYANKRKENRLAGDQAYEH